jgi:spore maturation protein CgeB
MEKTFSNHVLMISPSYYGIETSIAQAFKKNGFEPILLKHVTYSSLYEKIIREIIAHIPSIKKSLQPCLKIILSWQNRNYIELAKKYRPSFLLIIKGESVFPQTLSYIRRNLNIPCISYHWDDPFYSYNKSDDIDEYRRNNFRFGMKNYDYIFAFDKYYVLEIEKTGATNVAYVPLATDEELYKKVSLNQDEKQLYGYDICFVGMPFDNRIEIFNELSEFNIGVFGDLWDKYRDKLKGDYFKGPAIGDKVLKLYSASKIVLNINHPQSKYGTNGRTFDIPSCGAFEIVDYKLGMEDLFDLGNEIVCYHDVNELKGLVRYYLDHPGKRNNIAARGCIRVRNNHTWAQRVKKILDVLHDENIIPFGR